jgi:hypothetical protein
VKRGNCYAASEALYSWEEWKRINLIDDLGPQISPHCESRRKEDAKKAQKEQQR